MQVLKRSIIFQGAQDPPDVSARDSGEFCQYTSGQGTPTVKVVAGEMELALDTTLESQIACLYYGDELGLDIDHLQVVDFYCRLASATVHPAVSIAFGLTSARNDDIDTIAYQALFRLIGSTAVFCESDDGVNNNDDVATGMTLGTTLKRFTLDFASGLRSIVPGPSLGGKANLLFSMDDDRGNLRQVARLTTFDMSNYANNLQLFAQIQKGAASSVVDESVSAKLLIQRIDLRYKSTA